MLKLLTSVKLKNKAFYKNKYLSGDLIPT